MNEIRENIVKTATQCGLIKQHKLIVKAYRKDQEKQEHEIKKQIIKYSKCKIEFKEDLSDLAMVIPLKLTDENKQLEQLLMYDWCRQSELTDSLVIVRIEPMEEFK